MFTLVLTFQDVSICSCFAMAAVNFPDWSSALKSDTTLSEQERNSFKITIRWFLGFCKRMGVGADFEQARAFIEFAQSEKQASEWVVERWRDAIRWFFRMAARQVRSEDATDDRPAPLGSKRATAQAPDESPQWSIPPECADAPWPSCNHRNPPAHEDLLLDSPQATSRTIPSVGPHG